MGKSSEEIEELAERIEKLEEENKELRETVNKLRSSEKEVSETDSKEEQISRRSFLKKIGAGAIGLGALSLAPAASKVTISDTGITKDGSNSFWHQGNLDPSSQAVTAVNNETSLSVDISGDADSVDGYDITKNGGGGSGIIDFST